MRLIRVAKLYFRLKHQLVQMFSFSLTGFSKVKFMLDNMQNSWCLTFLFSFTAEWYMNIILLKWISCSARGREFNTTSNVLLQCIKALPAIFSRHAERRIPSFFTTTVDLKQWGSSCIKTCSAIRCTWYIIVIQLTASETGTYLHSKEFLPHFNVII